MIEAAKKHAKSPEDALPTDVSATDVPTEAGDTEDDVEAVQEGDEEAKRETLKERAQMVLKIMGAR